MKIISILLGCFLCIIVACNKTSFLEKKSNSNIVVPTTLIELRALLNNTDVFTFAPGYGEMSSDNYYINYATWQSIGSKERNAYTWETDLYTNIRQIDDWTIPCKQVFYANIVLEQLAKIIPSENERSEWNDIRGSALFLRAFAWNSLVQNFSKAYDSSTAANDLGIPLREKTDINQIYQRASVKESYEKIILDLHESLPFLSNFVNPQVKNRPSKPAVFALLSRIYLSARNYSKSGEYADSCIKLYDKLINYNTISTTAATPFDRNNDETIYYSQAVNYSTLLTISSTSFADTLLYQSYATNDLRKAIFFRTISGNNIGIKRGYSGTVFAYTGLATDEMYLNRAECYARLGNTTAAMNDYNNLLSKRWRTGTYTNQTATSAADALNKILTERRKELIWRGIRWTDLKRLNKEGAGIILKRVLNGQTYTLLPNSPLYIFPIPDDEISLSGITQNQRQ